MIRLTPLLIICSFLQLLCVESAHSDIARDPIGVNVSAASPMSLTVRFASTNGTRFTSDQALFCYRQLSSGQCDPTAILGRLPSGQDLGSTKIATTRITDVMTIPYSVIRSTLAIAQRVDFSDFYYVRRFIPEPGGDLGAGNDRAVFQKVTCHLAGPARVPLSLTHVQVFASEARNNRPVKLIRLDENNLENGKVYADVAHTGTGIVEGWWEVRRPGDPALQENDLLPTAALPPAQRGQQNRYLRIKKFRKKATTSGLVVIEGPDYSELPRNITGRHDLLLRIAASGGRENRARLDIDGEPLNVFSGAVAGFRIPSLEYHVPVHLSQPGTDTGLTGRLFHLQEDDGNSVWQLVWRAPENLHLVVQLMINEKPVLLAPAQDQFLRIPEVIVVQANDEVRINLLSASGQALSTELVTVQQ